MSNLENISQFSEPYSEKTLKQSRYDGRTLVGLTPQQSSTPTELKYETP